MTILDLVKHSVKTIVHTLTDTDRLAIVVFSTQSEVKMHLSEMNETGRLEAIEILNKIQATNQTNIWAGLTNGLKELRTNYAGLNRQFIFLLTDGQPNQSPTGGEDVMLKK